MTKQMNVIICIALSFMVLFSSIGFAALTDDLKIRGEVVVEFPSGLFITNISLDSSSNIQTQSASQLPYSTTIDAALDKTNSNNVTGTVTYNVTVYNNTSRVYAYRGLYYQTTEDGLDSSYNGNDLISETAANNKIAVTTDFEGQSTIIQPGQELTFKITYTAGRSVSYSTNYKTLINFQFGINVNSSEEALDAITEKFDNILNTSTTYQEIVDKIDDKYSSGDAAWKATYFGNVAGSSDSDSAAINTLFAGQLNMLIDGVEQPVTVIIKRENIDGNTQTGDDYEIDATAKGYGCEYTLYMTTDELTSYNSYPTIYAMVYTCDRNADGSYGKWYMIGERYEGTAQVVGYVGGTSGGSFDTGSWRAVSQTLNPSEGYSYTVNNNTTINTIVTARDDNATRALQTLIDEAYIILTENKYAGTGMVALENLYEDMASVYTVDTDGSPVVKSDLTRAVLVPYITRMENGLKQFELSELEALAKVAYLMLDGTGGEAADRSALQTVYDEGKTSGFFTDTAGVININDNASYTQLKTYVDELAAALEPFESE